MAKNRKQTLLIIGVILLIALMSGQEKKEGVIKELIVLPGQNVPILGELWVKETAISWVPEEATKVHWFICSDSNCNTIINQGYEALTDSEKISLNSKLTSQFKGATYDITITAPSTPGFYWYMGIPETKDNIRVISIYADAPSSPNAQKFEVREGVIVPCSSLDTNIESVPIQNGVIRVTVETRYSGNQPNCIIDSKNDAGFEVICNPDYTANVNGRQSTCTLITPPPPTTFNYRCVGSTINQVLNSNLVQIGTCNEGQVCGDAGVAKSREVTSTTELTLSWLAGVNGGMCTTIPGCIPNNECAQNTCVGDTCINNCGQTIFGAKNTGICESTTTWSPLTSSKSCGESFTQTSNIGTTRLAAGIACESGTCNLETDECEEEEDEKDDEKEFDFGKYIPFIIMFFAFIIGMKILQSKSI